jgi:hypothetical protein
MFVDTNKPLHVSVPFIRPSSGGVCVCALHQAHTQTVDIHIRPNTKQILNKCKSAEDIIVTAQSTAYGPLRMVE